MAKRAQKPKKDGIVVLKIPPENRERSLKEIGMR